MPTEYTDENGLLNHGTPYNVWKDLRAVKMLIRGNDISYVDFHGITIIGLSNLEIKMEILPTTSLHLPLKKRKKRKEEKANETV